MPRTEGIYEYAKIKVDGWLRGKYQDSRAQTRVAGRKFTTASISTTETAMDKLRSRDRQDKIRTYSKKE